MSNRDGSIELEGNGPVQPLEMEGSPVAVSQQPAAPVPPPAQGPNKTTETVLYSDIGINVLLNRLKQSIASARDFAGFLKKRSSLEEEHAQGLKRLGKTTNEAIQRLDSRQGSFAAQFGEVTRVHERMADHGIQFAAQLHQMHDDLTELSNTMEKGRKHWKQDGLNNEKKVKDAEALLEKAKTRYDTFAEKYDRARSGDTSGRVFSIKGPKSSAQHEEDLLKSVQSADADYQAKVTAAQNSRQENINSLRPQAIKALQDLITECDSAMLLQMHNFAAINEKLLVGNGLVVSPIRNANDQNGKPSMRELIQGINNENDFHSYISTQAPNVPPKAADIKYEKHPSLAPSQPPVSSQTPSSLQTATQTPPQSVNSSSVHTHKQSPSVSQPPSSFNPAPLNSAQAQRPGSSSTPLASNPIQRPGSSSTNAIAGAAIAPSFAPNQAPRQDSSNLSFRGPPPQQQQQAPPTNGTFGQKPPFNTQPQPVAYTPLGANGTNRNTGSNSAYPTNPVFGLSLEVLFRRDEAAVPMVVYQCIQAVDLFGLEVEGIYRLSGNANHVNQLKALFNNDAARVDFRNPENFHHDINSVAGLLKQFFRELPEPLLTRENYDPFIEAARIDDDVMRRDTLHAIINNLPDPNYATLRALVLHLNRVQERSSSNRMSSSNLAICFAPTVMGQHIGSNIADSGLQARVVDTILQNTYQIFDED